MSLNMSETAARQRVSPLVLADRLLALAQDADRAGFIGTAQHLLSLAHTVFDEKPAVSAH